MYYCKCWHTSVGADLGDETWFWFGAETIDRLRTYLIRFYHDSPAGMPFGMKKGKIFGKEFRYFRNPVVIRNAKYDARSSEIGTLYISQTKTEWISKNGNRFTVNNNGTLGKRLN